MTSARRSTSLLLLAAAPAVALLAPAPSRAAEAATAAGQPLPAAGADTTSTTTQPSTTQTTGAPAPEPSQSAPEVLATPLVRDRPKAKPRRGTASPQAAPGPSRAPRKGAKAKPRRPGARAKPNAGGARSKAKGPRAPAPSALTPPLPLDFSAPLAGVPGFFIESFRIPPFLLPIYQAAGTAYGVPWQVLAAINEVETDYGRDLSVSTAGAEGWMQFLPSSWATYGVDANSDGFKDPYNPADAIFAAGRYLRAAGAATNLRGAIFAYNHSQVYVQSVLLRARLLGGTPPELLGAITGLTQARFPVHARSHFSDGFPPAPSGSGPARAIPGTTIYSEPGAPVIAVQDGRVVKIGSSRELGRFVSLRDAYGNTYTYAQLGRIARFYPVLKPHEHARVRKPAAPLGEGREPRPTGPASAGTQPRAHGAASDAASAVPFGLGATPSGLSAPSLSGEQPPGAVPPSGSSAPAPEASTAAPGPLPAAPPPAPAPSASATPRVFRAGPNDVYLHRLHRGAHVIAGTVLGHVSGTAPATPQPGGETSHMLFQIRPGGPGAPLIDPKPILDGWVGLENSSVFRARGDNPYLASAPTAGQVLLESKQQLEQQVLANPDIDVYPCGRQDIQTGQIDRRVLATLEFLDVSGFRPTVTALKCGHSYLTTEGNVSEHFSGDAVDISQINGIPIAGHQGSGSITDQTVRRLLTLQGSMKPHQIITLMRYPGTDNTLAMSDHYDHIHVGFRPQLGFGAHLAGAFSSGITPSDWIQLISRLGEIPNPAVRSGPSPASIPVAPSERPGRKGAVRGHG